MQELQGGYRCTHYLWAPSSTSPWLLKLTPLSALTHNFNLGAAFELGRHEWFALRRLIRNSRNSAFTGGFRNRFLKETSQKDGIPKNMIMKRPLHGTLRLRNSPTGEQIQNGRRRVKLQEAQLPLDVAQNCFVLVFPLQLFLCWQFRNFLLRNKALVYLRLIT